MSIDPKNILNNKSTQIEQNRERYWRTCKETELTANKDKTKSAGKNNKRASDAKSNNKRHRLTRGKTFQLPWGID